MIQCSNSAQLTRFIPTHPACHKLKHLALYLEQNFQMHLPSFLPLQLDGFGFNFQPQKTVPTRTMDLANYLHFVLQLPAWFSFLSSVRFVCLGSCQVGAFMSPYLSHQCRSDLPHLPSVRHQTHFTLYYWHPLFRHFWREDFRYFALGHYL